VGDVEMYVKRRDGCEGFSNKVCGKWWQLRSVG
jgi:hypothetical protein